MVVVKFDGRFMWLVPRAEAEETVEWAESTPPPPAAPPALAAAMAAVAAAGGRGRAAP